MTNVQRANVILTVTDNELDYYVSKGFNVIDKDGNIIKRATLNDVPSLKEAMIRLTAENDKLKADIEQYSQQFEDMENHIRELEEKLKQKPKRSSKKEPEQEQE